MTTQSKADASLRPTSEVEANPKPVAGPEREPATSRPHIPVAKGGSTTFANLRLVCRQHNFREAEKVFGQGWMAKFTG